MTTTVDIRIDEAGRPTTPLPIGQLVRLSLYWLGLSAIFSGLALILTGRLQYDPEGLGIIPNTEGRALFQMTVAGAFIAMIVQPTVGTISDYTISRLGRRKPYILIGSVLDVVFLFGIASSNTVLAIAAFLVFLQFSSNMAQGPFQGYVPDLVPAQQVGLASGLVGLMQTLGSVTGFLIGSIAVARGEFFLGTMALGLIELTTMLSVVLRVREGSAPRDRAGRSWWSIGREAWGTDVLRERSFVWLVGSRFFVLVAAGTLLNLALFYLAQTHGMGQAEAIGLIPLVLGVATASTVLSVVPAGRISDRVGRKTVIYVSCAVGAIGLAIVAAAPSIPVALLGVVLYGISTGTFLAVDWALMTDIIPKAASGRYMGISNVATASSGIVAIAVGGTIMDLVNEGFGRGMGPRAALAFGVACYVVGAVLLRPVDERRRDLRLADPGSGAAAAVGVTTS
ncbi:MAG TPA: MFS transporter [Candidatus Limnocylindrales bacterium]|nr:MFS transporter [Candidatus Limnocylindrales bacterium]